MPTNPKIKIRDNADIRLEIDALYEQTEQVTLAKWALLMAKHVLLAVGLDYAAIEEVANGFRVNELWQLGKARVYDVRQAGFKIHAAARACENEAEKAALRAAGQAVGSGHMREHAMVASDYAIKAIRLLNGDDAAIKAERLWQLEQLKELRRFQKP